MNRAKSIGVLIACAGLAGCLTSGGGDGSGGAVVFEPVGGELDGVPPFGATAEVSVQMFSADLVNGASTAVATITFHTSGTFTIDLPGAGTLTVAEGDLDGVPVYNAELGTTVAAYFVGPPTNEHQLEIFLGEDAAGSDLFALARYEDLNGTEPSPVSYLLLGDETTTLPAGMGTFTGGFIADVRDLATGASGSRMAGTSEIAANFGAGTVGVTLTETGSEGGGVVFTGTATSIAGARYADALTGTGSGSESYSGFFEGAFFGPNAEATAGVFHAEDVGAGLEVIGGFTGAQ